MILACNAKRDFLATSGAPDMLMSALCLLLASCGTDGSTPPPVSNRAPVFTTPPAVSIAENTTGTVYAAQATDADGNALTYAISGGADASRFRITPTGALSLADVPDFENPIDADGNNTYLVQISASDGTATTVLDLVLTISNQGPDAFRVRRVGTGFNQPLFLAGASPTRAFVVEKNGLIRLLNPTTGTIAATPFLDVSSQISTSGERGLLGMAFAPDFTSSRAFYIYMINVAGNIEIRKYRTSAGNADLADPASADIILTVPHPGFDNHNGGWIEFGPDNYLYIGTGDGGGGGDPSNRAQNANDLLGKVLRIDPSSDEFPNDPLADYASPTSNPFVASGGGRREIWAVGMRNPFRASFDRLTGNLYIGDVGQDAVEEIDLIPSGVGGLNFGWRAREGTQSYNGGLESPSFTVPVTQYFHGSGPLQGQSVTGGYVYRGPVEALRGQYFFADFVSANIWSVPVVRLVQGQTLSSAQFTQRRAAFTPNAGSINNIASFGVDPTGNLYIVDLDGEIFVVEPA